MGKKFWGAMVPSTREVLNSLTKTGHFRVNKHAVFDPVLRVLPFLCPFSLSTIFPTVTFTILSCVADRVSIVMVPRPSSLSQFGRSPGIKIFIFLFYRNVNRSKWRIGDLKE